MTAQMAASAAIVLLGLTWTRPAALTAPASWIAASTSMTWSPPAAAARL